MQVPEKLSLIGGSILLSATLIFTMKSQAASLVPHVRHSIAEVFDHINDARDSSNFNTGHQLAKRNGQPIGTWGTSKWYIDDKRNLHIGEGHPQGQLKTAVGQSQVSNISNIYVDQAVQAPANSWGLLSDFTSVKAIQGLNKIDTSHVDNMSWAFSNDALVSRLNLSSWRTPHLTHMTNFFGNMKKLQYVDLSGLDTSHAYMNDLFMYEGGRQLRTIYLGSRTYLHEIGYLPDGTWKSNNATLDTNQLRDGNVHLGVWTREQKQ